MERAATDRVATTDTAADVGRLLLRLSLGLLILLHGVSKIRGGPGFVLDVVEKAGLLTRLDTSFMSARLSLRCSSSLVFGRALLRW